MSTDVTTYLLKAAAVFSPELKPLEGDIAAAVATVEKAEAMVAPYLAGNAAPTLFSLLPMFVNLEGMMPDIIKAAQTFGKVEEIAKTYEARIAAAEK